MTTVQETSKEETKVKEAKEKHTWVEEVEITGNELLERIKTLIEDGNARRVVIRAEDGKELMTIPLTVGVVAGGILTLALPMLAALGALAAIVTKVKLEVIREEEKEL